jgi:hypothetical protein
MEPAEKSELIKLAFHHVSKTSADKWATSFLKDLKLAFSPTQISYYLGNFNLINNLRFANVRTELRKLNFHYLEECFSKSNKCVIFIDHDALPNIEFGKNTM